MPRIHFPNVPKLPGVPQILRSAAGSVIPAPVALAGIALGRLALAFTSQIQWGVFDRGTDGGANRLVIKPDSIMGFDLLNDYTVSTFPVQQGNFASYNKVATPIEIILSMTKGGSKADREQFLRDLESGAFSLRLLTILTPEREYPNMNLIRYKINRRGVEGAYFFAEVDLFFLEIRQVTVSYTTQSAGTANSTVPAALPPANQGQVQPQVPGSTTTFNPAEALGVSP